MIGQFRFEVGQAHVGRQGDAAEDVAVPASDVK
jgi:hypothetical protein